MSVEAAVAYIKRMREDEDFRQMMNSNSEDEEACWALSKENGYDFSMSEFKQAQEEIYKEYDIVPM